MLKIKRKYPKKECEICGNKISTNNFKRHVDTHAHSSGKYNLKYSERLAEIFGILLGDGCLKATVIEIILDTKWPEYVEYVSDLLEKEFDYIPKRYYRKKSNYDNSTFFVFIYI